ncbi:MAG: hypothetical protein P8Q91_06305 [Porticoccaceae bacterium]|nr:hypothetical protein [Porticoccaceae bacterium]
MDVKYRYIAIFSIALNIFFATNYFVSPSNQSESIGSDPLSVGDEPNGQTARIALSETDDLIEFYSSLLAQGFTQDQTKPLLFTKLKQLYIDSIKKPDDKFWLHQPLAQVEYMEALFQGYQQIREALQAIYGDGVKHDTIVSDVFYPVANQYPFLTSQKQVAVQKMQLEMQKQAVLMQSQGGNPRGLTPEQSPQRRLSRVLDATQLTEYQLRTSPLANKMRQSEVVFTEAKFRKAYDVLLRLQHSSDSKTPVGVRFDLNDLLGDEDGLLLWAAIDPIYSVLRQVATRHNVPEGQALSAYDLILSAREDVSEAVAQRDFDPQQAGYQVQEIMSSLKNRLAEMVGEAAANDFINLVNGRRSPSPVRRNGG